MYTADIYYIDDEFARRLMYIDVDIRWTPISEDFANFRNSFRKVGTHLVDSDGVAGAEEVFDVLNNPERDDERYQIIRQNRSFSVGDVVIIDTTGFLCMPCGWSIFKVD